MHCWLLTQYAAIMVQFLAGLQKKNCVQDKCQHFDIDLNAHTQRMSSHALALHTDFTETKLSKWRSSKDIKLGSFVSA